MKPLCLLSMVVITVCVLPCPTLASKPNVVVILADDLGYGDVSCNNRERGKIATPFIDSLARDGMRFTDGHSSSGVCSPSRYTLLTGRYHWRTRLQSGIVGNWGPPLIAADRLTLPALMKQQGYRTACIGKWHLGWDWAIDPGDRPQYLGSNKEDITPTSEQLAKWKRTFSQPIPGGPTARGFDRYFGTDVPNWPPFCFIENDRTIGVPTTFLPVRLFQNNQASVQGPALADWTLEPILPELARRATSFITQHAERGEPYFLYLPLTSPHTPLAVNDAWKGKSGLNDYADFVLETDAVVGQVLVAIESSGKASDTLVVFTSDNGCAPYIGFDDLVAMGHHPSGPLRGYKSNVWEGGHRVPFIVRWPQTVAAGTVCDQLVHHADLIATCAEILSAKLPANAGEDSFSLMPLFKGLNTPVREHAISQSSGGLPGLRKGHWKLIFGAGSGGWGDAKDEQPGQLYNLADDLGETKNLYSSRPELVSDLSTLMDQLVSQGRSTPGSPQKNDVPFNWKKFLKTNDPR